MIGKISNEEVEAQKSPTTISISLNPQDAKLAEMFKPGKTVSMMAKGEVISVSMGEYGSSLSLEIEMIAFKEPKPESFVEELNDVRVSAVGD